MSLLPVVLLLALSGGLFYLSQLDRSSATALTVVELEGQLGLPLFAPVLLLALVFGVMALWSRRAPKQAVRIPSSRGSSGQAASSVRPRSMRGPVAPGSGWRELADRTAADAVFEDGVELIFSERVQVPYVLRLSRIPPERVRRAVGDYARVISGMPTPPRARIEFRGISDEGAPRHHLIAGAFGRFFERTDFRCIRAGEDVDVIFSQPDKRWLA